MLVYKIYSFLFNKYLDKSKKSYIKKSHLIWHFCSPKSASTFLMNYLEKRTKNYKLIRTVPHYGFRPQITCLNTTFHNMKNTMGSMFITAHQHSIYTEDLEDLISKNHKVIIQHRDIYHTILSMIDMIDSNIGNDFSNPFFFNDRNWRKLSISEKREVVITNYIPWHINFLKSWYYAKIPAKKYFINYSDLVKDPNKFISKIIEKDYINIDENFHLSNREKKFKVGEKRKNTFSKKEILMINDMINKNTHSVPKKLINLILPSKK